jgi:hypothetical protein
MNKSIPYIVTDNSITVVVKGKPYTISDSNASFSEVKNRITNEDFDGIEALFDTGAAVGAFTKGNIVVKNNTVLFKGSEVHNHVVDRILDFMRQGLPYKPLVNFLDKLLQNPSRRSVQELYSFLEHKNMPLTPEGNFLAYKSVRADYTDHRTGKFSNTVGSTLEMLRNEVCDNADIGCSYGFHAGSLDYAKSFGGSGSILLIVEINPADVVSIPKDCSCQKLRTWKYKVVGTFERPLTEALNTQYSPVVEDANEKQYDDEGTASNEIGYEEGSEDAAMGLARDAEQALGEVQDGSINDEAFIEGYHAGYDQNYVAPAPKTKVKATISDATRAKLRKAAKRQLRDDNGKFI